MRLNLVHFFTFCALLPSLVLGFAHRRSIDVRRADSLGRDWSLSNLGHGTLLPRASITDLEAAALGFIKLMQTIENGKYKQRQVLVVGGQAVQHWYPGFRETDDSDIKVQSGTPPVKSMKEALARNSNGQYEITLGGSNWKLDNGNLINIDAIDSDLSPYVPTGFKPASEINSAGDLPYISKTDLLVSKLISCNERTEDDKATKDAKDAFQIVSNELAKGGVSLTQAQKDVVNKTGCMARVAETTCTKPEWWDKSLGLQT
ncbi:MAG: hypothetical protein Q9190_005773 [Brigantiaea leucoxantha]